jgi:hypothetical protein
MNFGAESSGAIVLSDTAGYQDSLRSCLKNEKMKKENKADPCPVCGGEKNPTTKRSTSRAGTGNAVARKTPTLIAESVGVESSDDQTANDLAADLLKSRSRLLECK